MSHLHEANPAVTYCCPHGLVDNATPIIIDGIHYGNFFTGQFFLEKPDLDFFRAQAKKYGFDEDAYLEAVKKVPVWTQRQLKNYLFFIKGLIAVVSESGLAKLKEIEARKNIKRSSERIRSILKSAMDGYWLTDTEGRLLEVNDTYCRMSGYRMEELLSMRIYDLEYVESPGIMNEHMLKVIKLGSDRFESKHIRKDGTVFDVEVSVQLREEEDRRCVCFLRDITEKKQAEEALIKSEKKWHNILVNTPQIGITLNTNAEIIFANDHFLKLTGWKEEEVIGQNWFDMFLPEEVRKEVRAVFHSVMNEKATHGFSNYENEILTRSGEIRKIFWSNVLTYDIKGEITDVTCLGVDLTERDKAEAALKQSEELLLTVLNSIDATIYVADMETYEIKFMNKKMIDVFGRDATGQQCWQVFRGESGPCGICVNSQLVGKNGELLDTIIWHDQNPITGGHYINYDRAIKWIDGRIVKIQIASDITEFRKMESQPQQAQKMEAVGTLAGGIAHDFNNLLQAINGYTQLLLIDKTEYDTEYLSLNAIQKSVNRAAELVRQLLLFSRKAETERIPINLNMVVEQARDILERTIPKMVDIDVIPGSRLWPLTADPVQLEQIILNLGTNAADAMPDGGKLVIKTENISVGPDDSYLNLGNVSGQYVLLTVSDTGYGMDRETMDKIFEPFFTTKELGRGTGLGLASVYGIVKKHGGHITCQSKVDEGTLFSIYLPATDETNAEEEKVFRSTPPESGTETILIVDDESEIRGFAKQALMKFGYTVLTASSGEDALELYSAKSKKIDLVITDIGMPGMGGHKCIQEIIQIDPAAKILIASGYSIKDQVIGSLKTGAAGYLEKPYQLFDLLRKVRDVLDDEE